MAPHPHDPSPDAPPHSGRGTPELPGLQPPLPERPASAPGGRPEEGAPDLRHGAEGDAPGRRHPPSHEVP